MTLCRLCGRELVDDMTHELGQSEPRSEDFRCWCGRLRREPQTAAELADKWIAHFRAAIKNGTGNVAVCRDMIDRWLDHRNDHGDEPRQPL